MTQPLQSTAQNKPRCCRGHGPGPYGCKGTSTGQRHAGSCPHLTHCWEYSRMCLRMDSVRPLTRLAIHRSYSGSRGSLPAGGSGKGSGDSAGGVDDGSEPAEYTWCPHTRPCSSGVG